MFNAELFAEQFEKLNTALKQIIIVSSDPALSASEVDKTKLAGTSEMLKSFVSEFTTLVLSDKTKMLPAIRGISLQDCYYSICYQALKTILNAINILWRQENITSEELRHYHQVAYLIQKEIWNKTRVANVNDQELAILKVLHQLGDRAATVALIDFYELAKKQYKAQQLGSMASILYYADKHFDIAKLTTQQIFVQAFAYYMRAIALICKEIKRPQLDSYSRKIIYKIDSIDTSYTLEILMRIRKLFKSEHQFNLDISSTIIQIWKTLLLTCIRNNIYLPARIFDKEFLLEESENNMALTIINLLLQSHWCFSKIYSKETTQEDKLLAYMEMQNFIGRLRTIEVADGINRDDQIVFRQIYREILYRFDDTISMLQISIPTIVSLSPIEFLRRAAVLGHKQAGKKYTEYLRTYRPNGERLLIWSGTCDVEQDFSNNLIALLDKRPSSTNSYHGIRTLAKCCQVAIIAGAVKVGDTFIPMLFEFLNQHSHRSDGFTQAIDQQNTIHVTQTDFILAFERLKKGLYKDQIPYPQDQESVPGILFDDADYKEPDYAVIEYDEKQFAETNMFVSSAREFIPIEPEAIIQAMKASTLIKRGDVAADPKKTPYDRFDSVKRTPTTIGAISPASAQQVRLLGGQHRRADRRSKSTSDLSNLTTAQQHENLRMSQTACKK
jgi:hypothetical protein